MDKMAEEKKRKGLSVFLRIVIALVLILIIIFGFIFFYVKGKLNKIQKVELPKGEDLGITETVAQNYRNSSSKFNGIQKYSNIWSRQQIR